MIEVKALEDQIINVIHRPSQAPLFETSPRWVRVKFGKEFLADSKNVKLMLEPKRIGIYYFPLEDVRVDLLRPSEKTRPATFGTRRFHHVEVGDKRAEDAAWTFEDIPEEFAFVAGHVGFYWDRMDGWFEEDDEVFVHPRDPYKRVDVLQSSRHVEIKVEGETLAETTRPRLLFETGLPTRYYIPKLDVRMDLLEPTETTTRCPYKGGAVYWSARVGEKLYKDIVWGYPAPIPECPKIENHLAFFNERVEIFVDSELQPVPETPWSRA
jgi:uncharacterized protein (DUF427 family)